MSDASEKHFEPTPSRLAKAKREGNAPHAAEFASNAAFGAAVIAACFVVPSFGALGARAIRIAAAGRLPIGECVALLFWALVPACAAAAAGTLAAALQHGGLHVAPLKVSGERLNPIEGLKRMCSRETLSHAARAALAFALAAGVAVPSVRDVLATSTATNTLRSLAGATWAAAQHVVFAALAVGAIFAIAEYAVARASWIKKLRMSFAEFKREMKEQDGDPTVRGRRRALHRSLVRGSLARVKDASFVVVNPTHVAVALEYKPPSVPVPTVLVRAADDGALRVRALATQHGVPVVEDIPLARALFAQTRVGEPIPQTHFIAVAEIVAHLRRVRGEPA